ncbi:MAG: hypothetical protein K9J79_05475 [Desulfobacteraceae bacterium]|nr:hypothetical protein [Desulfobacteraceae bacterium]
MFICKGNLCRSPFAEYLASVMHCKNGFFFASAGLEVGKSNRPPEEALHAASRLDTDISGHFSREVDLDAVRQADMILAMEHAHLRALQKRFPTYKAQMYLLPFFDTMAPKEPSGYARANIFDPFGKDAASFDVCFDRIHRCLCSMFVLILSAEKNASVKI